MIVLILLRRLTRTIKVIFLSQFLRFILLSRKFIMQAVPGCAPLHASKLLHRDSKVAPNNLVPRYCTSAFEPHSAPGIKSCRQRVCTAIAPARKSNCTLTAKIAPCFAPFGLRNMSSQNDKSCRRHSGRLSIKNELLLPGRYS